MVRSLRNSSWLVLGLLVAATSAQAQWMWRDKGGRMHMSDLPPPAEVPEKDVLKRPAGARAPAATAPGASPAASAPASAPQPGTPTAAAAPRVDKVAAAKAENCDRAQKHMRTIDSGVRMSRLNDKGEREVMDDRLRAEEAERTRGVIAANCAQ
jgi:hypothetical protein